MYIAMCTVSKLAHLPITSTLVKYVCMSQFHVISRQPHTDTEHNQNGIPTWIIPDMEVGANKPEHIVMCMNR